MYLAVALVLLGGMGLWGWRWYLDRVHPLQPKDQFGNIQVANSHASAVEHRLNDLTSRMESLELRKGLTED